MGTKEKIFETALDLFSKKGFNATSIREITKNTGITVAAFYNHFESKNKLLQAIYNYYTGLYISMEKDKPDYGKLLDQYGPIEFFKFLTRSYIESMKNEKLMKLTRIIVMEQYTNKTAGEIAYKDRQRLLASMEELFELMHGKGLIKADNPQYAGMLMGYVYLGFASDNIYFYFLGNMDPDDMIQKQSDIVTRILKDILL